MRAAMSIETLLLHHVRTTPPHRARIVKVAHSSGVTSFFFVSSGLVRMMAGGDVDGEGAARRRRQRRLRPWLKHERQSVAMALAEYTHHASGSQTRARAREGVEHATHSGLRPQKTPPPGERPGLLLEPGPQRSDRTVRRSSGDNLPTLALPVLAGSAGEAVDASSLRYLSAAARLDQSRQRAQQLREEVQAWDHRPTRRKKKRKKKKLPRGRFSRGRARRRQRQWHVSGSPGDVLLRAVFPSFVDRPEMPCIMAGMDQKDRCSCMYKAGIDGYNASRAVFPSLVDRPRMLGILAGMDLKDSCCGMSYAGIAGDSAPRAVFVPFVRSMMLRIMAGMHQKDSCPRRTGKLDYFGDDVVFFYGPLYLEVTCSSCLPEEYRVALFREMTPGMVSVFSSLGSTADTCSASVYEVFWKNFTRFLLGMTAENCGVSAVAVHRWSSIISFHGAQADSHGPAQ